MQLIFHLHFHFSFSAPETYSGFDKSMIPFWKFSPIYMEKDSTYWLGSKKVNRYLNSCSSYKIHCARIKTYKSSQIHSFCTSASQCQKGYLNIQSITHTEGPKYVLNTYIPVRGKHHLNNAVLQVHSKQSGCKQTTYFSKFCRCSLTFCTRPSLVSLTTKSSQR